MKKVGIEFAYRICAQTHTEEVENNILLSLKELKRSRFNDDGPAKFLQNLEEGKNLLLETDNEDEKKLINLAINSIKRVYNHKQLLSVFIYT